MPEEIPNYEYVLNRYAKAIDYYWASSKSNKRNYKLTRSLTVILGAIVTLVASLSSADIASGIPGVNLAFKILTPVLAAALAICGGFSQAFQWGAAWQDMVLTAQHLEKERDRFKVSKPEGRDCIKEVALLNEFVLTETQGFFQRLLGSAKPPGTAGK